MAAIPDLIDFSAHTQAKAAEVDANFAALLAMLDPNSGADGGIDGVNMKKGTSGQLWVAGSTGVYARKTMTGDASINSAGALSISDAAVTSRKFNPSVGQKVQTGGAMTVDDTMRVVPGTALTINPAVASQLLVWGSFDFTLFDANHTLAESVAGYLQVDGTNQLLPAGLSGTFDQNSTTHIVNLEATVTQNWVVPLDDSSHTIQLRTQRLTGANFAVLTNANFSYLLVAT